MAPLAQKCLVCVLYSIVCFLIVKEATSSIHINIDTMHNVIHTVYSRFILNTSLFL